VLVRRTAPLLAILLMKMCCVDRFCRYVGVGTRGLKVMVFL